MAFKKRDRRQHGTVRATWPGSVVTDFFHLSFRIILWVVIIGVIGSGLVYLRLAKGPLHLPFVASIATQIFNNSTNRLQVELGDLVLTLGAPGAPAGVRMIDLQVSITAGDVLFRVPQLAVKFDIGDLLHGYLRPTHIVVIEPEARLLKTREGTFRFGLGAQPAVDQTTQPKLAGETPQMAAILRILDGLVGDAEPTPELLRLRGIVISNADLTFVNEANGRRWHSRRADFSVMRTEDGLRAGLSVGLADSAGAGMVVSAERRRGENGATHVNMRFDRLRPEHLAEQLEQMQWLRLFDAPLNGTMDATVQANGQIDGLTGQITAGAGQILALQGRGQPFESAKLAFAYEPGRERMQVSEMSIVSKALDAQLSGFVDLARDDDGEVSGLLGQFEIARLRTLVPEAFSEALQFDGGQIVAKLDFDPMRIKVADVHLRSGDLVVDVSGEARAAAQGWQIDLRAAGRNLTVRQLVQFWPLKAAKNARRWVEKNISIGVVDDFIANMRFGYGEPQVNLDFSYSGLVSSYLKKMTPIREAQGRGSLTQNSFNLILDAGEITPVEGAPIQLGGSTMNIPDLSVEHAPAEVAIRGDGPTGSILTLIDEHPLGLMKKLGLPPASIKGGSVLVAELAFPLITTLKLDQVEVEANARLDALQMPFRLPSGQVLDVAGNGVALRATKRALNISGDVVIDGTPMRLGWNEGFKSDSNHREIDLKGRATPEMLERFGLGNRYFVDGYMLMDLHLRKGSSPGYEFDMTSDLGPARLEVTEFNWVKAPGREGKLKVAGEYGDGVHVSHFTLDTSELKATGALDFAKSGEVTAAKIERVRFRDFADVAVAASLVDSATGEYSLKITGDRLDLAMFGDTTGTAAGDNSNPSTGRIIPLAVDFTLKELVVTPSVITQPGTGTYHRDSAGDVKARLRGLLVGLVPFTAQYERVNDEPGDVTVLADDAGALLKAAGLFQGAIGGRLRLRARIAPEVGVSLVGIAKIEDVRISGAGTFKSILDEGGAKEAVSAAEGGGLAFDKVRVPFEYRDGVLILGGSTAKGRLLAVKIEGTLDETSDQLDLVGVISPVYALTGVLDNIPVIGDILSGGKGEGILAMTFTVQGSLNDPDFSVNPLSLLAPGILRSIFSGRSKPPNEKFLKSIKREVD